MRIKRHMSTKQMIKLYKSGHTLAYIGKLNNITRERVRQIIHKEPLFLRGYTTSKIREVLKLDANWLYSHKSRLDRLPQMQYGGHTYYQIGISDIKKALFTKKCISCGAEISNYRARLCEKCRDWRTKLRHRRFHVNRSNEQKQRDKLVAKRWVDNNREKISQYHRDYERKRRSEQISRPNFRSRGINYV